MRIKFFFSLAITLLLIYLLDNRWVVGDTPVPAIGRFLDPFHGFWQNIESRTPQGFNAVNLPHIKDKVKIVFDSLDIPHIFANNDEDLYYAQGYVTAMHRLWQMEFQTHAAAGRVSEITGAGKDSVILNYDRGQRRQGMTYAAENALEALNDDKTARMMIRQYTAGVNAYIKSLEYKNLPFEYKLLNYDPEPWTPLKSALLLKSMAQTLNMGDKDIEMTNALKLYGKNIVDLLYPDRDIQEDPIVSKPENWKFKPVLSDSIPMAIPEELVKISNKIPQQDPTTGSNNWAVSGSKTKSGSPILCGDPHLNLNLPSLWYVVQLNAPGINCMGASLPGTPTVIIGFNDSIAWSVTNAQRDLVDWFKITFQDQKKEKYLLDGNWVDSRKVIEAFRVRDQHVFYDTVVYTQWGPVTYDERFNAENNLKHYAFRWISHDASNEFLTFYQLNRARNHTEFSEALDSYASPAQNFVFASASGDIAVRVQGRYPARRKDEGKFVLDGSKSFNGWHAYIPNEQNVMDKNPTRGFVSSANQYPVDDQYPYFITATHFENYRNRRINQVLSELSAITPTDMMKLQNDNYNLRAAESLPYFLQHLDTTAFSAEEKKAYQVLKSWDYTNSKESIGASYYEAWWGNFMPLVWDELNQEKVSLSRPTTFNTIKLTKEKPDLIFFDIQSTPEKETAPDVIRKSFSFGVEDIEDWVAEHTDSMATEKTVPAWADYKDSYLTHLLRLEQMNIHIRAGGGRDIVNAHSRTHGPSWRMIVSLEKTGPRAWATYPGGQSANPGSSHYTDMLGRWLDGKYFPLHFLKTPVEAKGITTRTFELNPIQQ
ncbi:penicillin acylase family protein [Chryseolinea sp. H1M3-3]|uniref:penicillin acylase family protein n=1 Tax=Chryseolinea sp. H1M3-3 TaxID=3034144 RepID=UPI0023ECEAB9|nr:penicillin acylase family protein [Chryseolinea sp. H1M3-3]